MTEGRGANQQISNQQIGKSANGESANRTNQRRVGGARVRFAWGAGLRYNRAHVSCVVSSFVGAAVFGAGSHRAIPCCAAVSRRDCLGTLAGHLSADGVAMGVRSARGRAGAFRRPHPHRLAARHPIRLAVGAAGDRAAVGHPLLPFPHPASALGRRLHPDPRHPASPGAADLHLASAARPLSPCQSLGAGQSTLRLARSHAGLLDHQRGRRGDLRLGAAGAGALAGHGIAPSVSCWSDWSPAWG